MALGYEGIAYLSDSGGTYHSFLCTGGSIPVQRNLLESQSAYGGVIASPTSEIAIGYPHTYDEQVWEGSFNFDLTSDLLTNVLKTWLFARQSARKLKYYGTVHELRQFDNCFWNSISFSASDGSIVNGSVGLVALNLDANSHGDLDLYESNKEGYITPTELASGGVIPALNPSSGNVNPIPFWKTQCEGESSGTQTYDFVSWNLTFNQDVVKLFGCEYNADPQAPMYLAVGPMSIVLEGSNVTVEIDDTLYEDLDSMTVTMGNDTIVLTDLEIQNEGSVDISGQSDVVPIELSWNAYGLSNSSGEDE
jgi:hypothetical protein